MSPTRAPTCTCGKCDKCRARERVRRWQRENPDKVAARDRRYRQRNRKAISARRRANYERDRAKHAARRAVYRALQAGTLERGPCDVCGITENVQAHHHDYAKPLEVTWLCRPHHREAHRGS